MVRQRPAKEKPQPSMASKRLTVKQAIAALTGEHHGEGTGDRSTCVVVHDLGKSLGVFLDKLSSWLRHFRVTRRLSR